MRLQPRYCIGVVPVMLALAIVAGCGKSEGKKAATQVAAKVNSAEITISQINYALARSPGVAPEAAEQAKREILNKLIDAELARQGAIEKKLDRSPNVLQALEMAKTEILARAYVEQVTAAQPKPAADEIKKYYTEHAELFSQRRVYSIEEISIPAQEGLAATLQAQVAKSRSLQDVASWLKSQGIQFTGNRGVRTAEQLPFDYLPQLQTMKDGDIRVFERARGMQVIRVAASQSAPVNEATATPRIQQFLLNQRSSVAIGTDMNQLREKAKIEYIGEFAAGAAEAGTKAKAAAEAKASADADAKAQREAGSKQAGAAKPAASPTPDIEKGISGLVR